MILAFDTYYLEGKARTACLAFKDWKDKSPNEIFTETLDIPGEYESGEFYKRELPCILSLLDKIEESEIEAIVIDGFVILDDTGKHGLGGYLYEHLKKKIPVIGVAKTNFAQNTINKREVYRGGSARPLYITALGTDLTTAARHIRSMHGTYRLPTLLKLLDRITRERL